MTTKEIQMGVIPHGSGRAKKHGRAMQMKAVCGLQAARAKVAKGAVYASTAANLDILPGIAQCLKVREGTREKGKMTYGHMKGKGKGQTYGGGVGEGGDEFPEENVGNDGKKKRGKRTALADPTEARKALKVPPPILM